MIGNIPCLVQNKKTMNERTAPASFRHTRSGRACVDVDVRDWLHPRDLLTSSRCTISGYHFWHRIESYRIEGL